MLPTHTETPRNTTRKIANLYIEFNYHFLTLQKKSHYFWTGVYNEGGWGVGGGGGGMGGWGWKEQSRKNILTKCIFDPINPKPFNVLSPKITSTMITCFISAITMLLNKVITKAAHQWSISVKESDVNSSTRKCRIYVSVNQVSLFGAKPIHEPMLTYCQLETLEQTSMEFGSKCQTFHSWKCIWICRLRNGGHNVAVLLLNIGSIKGLPPARREPSPHPVLLCCWLNPWELI